MKHFLPLVVYDTGITEFLNNMVFNSEHACKFPGASIWPIFKDSANKRGWVVMTSDIYLKNPINSSITFCISEMITPFSKNVLNKGAVPLILLTGESPNVAVLFYHKIEKYAKIYKHAFLFHGLSERVKHLTCFHSLYWPNSRTNIDYFRDWEHRAYLTTITSNKSRLSINESKPLKRVRRLVKKILYAYIYLKNPFFRFQDLYEKRTDVICYFANNSGFRLFGTGWDKQRSLNEKQWHIIKNLKPVAVVNKLEILKNFKYSLCFENCVFPGYITEKIFDCFFAGCIPVYYGAPDICDFLPSCSFIDFRDFDNLYELNYFLSTMPEKLAKKYTRNAMDFINSSEFDRFTDTYFVDKIIKIIEHELALQRDLN
jgi:hypothetical protein